VNAPPVTVADLTPRQLSVVALVAKALPDKRIAGELGIEVETVREHLERIARKLDLDPTCHIRMQIAFWFRAQAPISLGRVVPHHQSVES
jgi:DNA-binding NarL/FixJ family response regulator